MSLFIKAEQIQTPARIALMGVSGSGKTYTSLKLAEGLADGGKIAVIDTERGSSAKYSDLFDFYVLNLRPPYTPQSYIEAIKAAEHEGFKVIIIDSGSHVWQFEGGFLDVHKAITEKRRDKNGFAAWQDLNPIYTDFVDTIFSSQAHVIMTLRVKSEYVVDRNESGKTQIRKVGLKPIQRDGLDYEFDIAGQMTSEHTLIIEKTRYIPWTDKIFKFPDVGLGKELLEWCNKGKDRKEKEKQILLEMVEGGIKEGWLTELEKKRIVDAMKNGISLDDILKAQDVIKRWEEKRKNNNNHEPQLIF